MKHVVIIGSSIAGQSAAFNIREQDREIQITLVSEEQYPLYDRRLLPDYLAGRIEEETLFLCTQDFYRQKNIAFITQARVSAVYPDKKTVAVRKGETVRYDALVIASGVRPALPEIRGARKPGVDVLWNLTDARAVRARIFTEPICVVGADTFSFETARALAERFRQEVKLVSGSRPRVTVDDRPVEIIPVPLDEIIGEGQVQAIRLSGGKVIGVGAVLFISSSGSVDFLRNTSLASGDTVVRVDGTGRTNIPGIYACGTVASCGDEPEPSEKSGEQCAHEGRLIASCLLSEMEGICQSSS